MTRALSYRPGALALSLAAAAGFLTLVSGAHGDSGPATKAKPSAAGATATVGLRKTGLGIVLVDSRGHTLYLFEKDRNRTSSCSGSCAQFWPPLMVTGKPRAGNGVHASMLGTIKRQGGKLQVSYSGHPLYLFQGDSKAGATTGEGLTNFGAPWYVLGANGKAIIAGSSSGVSYG
jgi:predicted lipoprotein with Yx(FWY)xxD motif